MINCRFFLSYVRPALLAGLLLYFIGCATPAHAQSVEDISRMNDHTMLMKKSILDKIAGDQELELGPLCGQVSKKGYMTRLEQGKLAYNHIFNDIKTPEQAADIKKLYEDLGDVDACEKNLRIWNAYDDKWYAQEHNRKYAEQQASQKIWLSQVRDRGEQYWDGVINGTFFSIPRAHIWFGSRKPDGSSDINLRFYAPDMSPHMDESGLYGKNADIAGVLTRSSSKTAACIGFADKKECTSHSFQNLYVQHALECFKKKGVEYYYNARWRRACKYGGILGQKYIEKPVYDPDVEMMKLGDRVYFEGDAEFPTSYMLCPKPKTKDPAQLKELYHRCETAIEIDSNVYFYYGFPQSMFWEHKKLQAELKKKIQSFIVRPERVNE